MPENSKLRQKVDPLTFKITAANHVLTNIAKKLPKNIAEKNKLELHVQEFLFFASGAIEVIKREINSRFEIFDKENVFYIYGLKKHLLDDGIQGKIKETISNYFSTPEYNYELDTKNSSLWRLQTLRNQAMHGNIIKIIRNKLHFKYTIRTDKEHVIIFVESTENPYRYFKQLFDELCNFIIKTKKIMNPNYKLKIKPLQT